MDITFVTNANSDKEAMSLLSELGLPFKKPDDKPKKTEVKAKMEPVVEEAVTEEPVVEEAVTEEPVVEEAVTEEPVVEEAVTEEPVAEEEESKKENKISKTKK